MGHLATLGEDFQQAVAGDAFATVDLCDAVLQAGVEGGLAQLKPFLFGLEEIERLGDNLCGRTVVAAREFTLDALFGCGIELW